MEWWCNSESLGRDKYSRLLMILHFINCISIKVSSVSLKRCLQISLHKVSFHNFETSFLTHFLFPRFNVLTDVVSSAFPSIKSELCSYCECFMGIGSKTKLGRQTNVQILVLEYQNNFFKRKSLVHLLDFFLKL